MIKEYGYTIAYFNKSVKKTKTERNFLTVKDAYDNMILSADILKDNYISGYVFEIVCVDTKY